VCHSLGNRVGLELLRCLASDAPRPNLRVTRFCLMAAAVPEQKVAAGGQLRDGALACERTLVLHSRSDRVLEFAFPAGQTAANFFVDGDDDEGFFPTAVGRNGDPRNTWTEPLYNLGTFDYGHSDYWTGKTNGESTAAVAEFLGAAIDRQISQRVPPTRPPPDSATLPSAKLPTRDLPPSG
jgi:hypothetical protein